MLSVVQHAPEQSPVYVSSAWTLDHYEYLRTCWASGMSARDTAVAINNQFGTVYSRNSIIGKVARHNLSDVLGRPRHAGSGRVKAALKPRKERANLCRNVGDIDDALIPVEQRKALLELEPRDCRWPVGNPDEAAFFFCGGEALTTSPYCAGHHKRAYGYTSEKKSGPSRFAF